MTGAAGSEGHLQALLPGLRARGVDARLWMLVEPGNPVEPYAAQMRALQVPVEQVIIRRDLDPALWRTLVRRFRSVKPDIVHTHLLHADLHAVPAARRAGVPVVVSSRHNDDKFRRWLPVRLAHRWLWRQIDAGIAISDAIRRFSIEVEAVAPQKIVTIHYGLDPADVPALPGTRTQLCEQLGLSADAVLIGSVCRLIEQKGLVYGLRAFSAVAADFPETVYVVVGEGPERPRLEREAAQAGIADRVHFLGWRDDARALMSALDLLLAPSLWEGFGLVFLEAMALRVPILSTQVSAIPEVVIDGETGWLVPAGDAGALAAALRDALARPAALRARGEAGYQRLCREFSPEQMVSRTLALYDSLEARA